MGPFCMTQQNFLITCSEPCHGLDPGDEEMKDLVLPYWISQSGGGRGQGAHDPSELGDKED